MKNKKIVQMLINADVYEADYDKVCEDDDKDTISVMDSVGIKRPIKNIDLSDEDIQITLAVKNNQYLKSINSKLTFFVTLSVIGICISAIVLLFGM